MSPSAIGLLCWGLGFPALRCSLQRAVNIWFDDRNSLSFIMLIGLQLGGDVIYRCKAARIPVMADGVRVFPSFVLTYNATFFIWLAILDIFSE